MRIPEIKLVFNSRRIPGCTVIDVSADWSPYVMLFGIIYKLIDGIDQGKYKCVTGEDSTLPRWDLIMQQSLREIPIGSYDDVKQAVIDLFAKVREDENGHLFI